MITTVTREIWRNARRVANTFANTAYGPYFDAAHVMAPSGVHKGSLASETIAIYEMEYVAEALPFEQIEAHAELGGHALALRENVVYAIFTEQDGPGFAELWRDVTYHMIVRIGEPTWARRDDLSSLITRS